MQTIHPTLYPRAQRGFTVIELMIIVAIISILAAIAVPAYTDYVARSKVAEGIQLAHGAEIAATEYYTTQGRWPKDNTAAGLAAPEHLTGHHVESVTVTNNQIAVLFHPDAGASLGGQILFFTAADNNGILLWACTSTTIPNKFLPPNCRSGETNKNTSIQDTLLDPSLRLPSYSTSNS